jgi:hypothetical protein
VPVCALSGPPEPVPGRVANGFNDGDAAILRANEDSVLLRADHTANAIALKAREARACPCIPQQHRVICRRAYERQPAVDSRDGAQRLRARVKGTRCTARMQRTRRGMSWEGACDTREDSEVGGARDAWQARHGT